MSDASQAIVTLPHSREVEAADFMPVLTVEQAIERKGQINKFIAGVLREGEDYGKLQGYNKPELLKPGAEKLCSIFGMSPRFIVEVETEDWSGTQHGGEPFFYYRYKCQLFRGERLMGESVGSCNTFEKKYRWRASERKCPECEAAAIIAGKVEFGGGWVCFKKKSGCGAKFAENDARITSQQVGRIPNPDVADQVNTVQKMAQKRALVAAVLIVTNCSDAFTQDLSDTAEELREETLQRRLKEEQQKQAESDPPELTAMLAKYTGKADNDEPLVSDLFQAVKEAHDEKTATKLWQMYGNPDKDPSLYTKIARQMWLTLNAKK
jgi:hypothetical protein